MNDNTLSRLAAAMNDKLLSLRAYEVEVEQRAAAAVARVRRLSELVGSEEQDAA